MVGKDLRDTGILHHIHFHLGGGRGHPFQLQRCRMSLSQNKRQQTAPKVATSPQTFQIYFDLRICIALQFCFSAYFFGHFRCVLFFSGACIATAKSQTETNQNGQECGQE